MWTAPLQISDASLISIGFGVGAFFFIFGLLFGSIGFIFGVYPQKLMGRMTISGAGETRTIKPDPTDMQLIIIRIFGTVFAIIGISIIVGLLVLAFIA